MDGVDKASRWNVYQAYESYLPAFKKWYNLEEVVPSSSADGGIRWGIRRGSMGDPGLLILRET